MRYSRRSMVLLSPLAALGCVTLRRFVWTTNEGRGGLLHFAWIHLGVAHDAWRPYLSIYFSGDLASSTRRELNQQWTAILGSLRPLSK